MMLSVANRSLGSKRRTTVLVAIIRIVILDNYNVVTTGNGEGTGGFFRFL